MKHLFTLAMVLAFGHANFAQGPWSQPYINSTINGLGFTTFNYIESGPDGAMYLAEQILSDFTDYAVRVQRFEDNEWIQVGTTIPTALYDASEAHFDFKVTPDGDIFVGVPGTIFKYDAGEEGWMEIDAPHYIGGLAYAGNESMYFISSTEGASGPAFSNLQLSLLQAGGSIASLETMASNLQMTPRVLSRSNQIVVRNDAIHVCVLAQGSNGLYFFRGNLDFGITPLTPLSGQPTLTADLGLSSMVVEENSTVVVSLKSGDELAMFSFEQFGSQWEPFTTAGINATSCNVNQLRYDNDDVLHLIYNGSNGTGFLFALDEGTWTHVGPTDLTGLLSVAAPHMAFDSENEIYFTSGIGSSMVPLVVRTSADVDDFIVSSNDLQDGAKLHVYPNPARDFFALTLPEGNPGNAPHLRIFGTDGKLYHSATLLRSRSEVHLAGFAPGVYILLVDMGGGKVLRDKLVVY